MSELNSLINAIPVDRLAQQFGVSGDDIRKAVESIAPALIGGMQANAQDSQGAESLTTALKDHANNTDLLADPDPAKIDTQDGDAIAAHIFGQNKGAVVDKVSQQTSTDKSLIEKLLPILAPLVMAWLASRMFSPKNNEHVAQEPAETDRAAEAPVVPGQTGTDSAPTSGATSNDLQDMLGGILGGGSGSASPQSGGGLGDLLGSLGGLLGGGRR